MSIGRINLLNFRMNLQQYNCTICNKMIYHTYFCNFKMKNLMNCKCDMLSEQNIDTSSENIENIENTENITENIENIENISDINKSIVEDEYKLNNSILSNCSTDIGIDSTQLSRSWVIINK